MSLNNLHPAKGSNKSSGKRLGRGQGSGKGGTSTKGHNCLLYTSPSPRDRYGSRMPSSA